MDFHKGLVPASTYRPRLPSLKNSQAHLPHQKAHETVQELLNEEQESMAERCENRSPIQQRARTSPFKVAFAPINDENLLDPASEPFRNLIQPHKITAPIKRSVGLKKLKPANHPSKTRPGSDSLERPIKTLSAANEARKHEILQKQIQQAKKDRARKAAQEARAKELEEETKRARLSQLDAYCKSQRRKHAGKENLNKTLNLEAGLSQRSNVSPPTDSLGPPNKDKSEQLTTACEDPLPKAREKRKNQLDVKLQPETVVLPTVTQVPDSPPSYTVILKNSDVNPKNADNVNPEEVLEALRDIRKRMRQDQDQPTVDYSRMSRAAEKAEWLRRRFESLAANRMELDTDDTDLSQTQTMSLAFEDESLVPNLAAMETVGFGAELKETKGTACISVPQTVPIQFTNELCSISLDTQVMPKQDELVDTNTGPFFKLDQVSVPAVDEGSSLPMDSVPSESIESHLKLFPQIDDSYISSFFLDQSF